MAERYYADLQRIRLARNLALIVLQFHATPLMNSSCTGDDIVFFGDFGVGGQHSLQQSTDILDISMYLPKPYFG
jgi:hypothetical protein